MLHKICLFAGIITISLLIGFTSGWIVRSRNIPVADQRTVEEGHRIIEQSQSDQRAIAAGIESVQKNNREITAGIERGQDRTESIEGRIIDAENDSREVGERIGLSIEFANELGTGLKELGTILSELSLREATGNGAGNQSREESKSLQDNLHDNDSRSSGVGDMVGVSVE